MKDKKIIFCIFTLSMFFIFSLFNIATAREVEFIVAGDVTLTYKMNEHENLSLFSNEALSIIKQADMFIWNCEFTGNSNSQKDNRFIFLSSGILLPKIVFPNGVASTANNHIFDGHQRGASSLLGLLKMHGVEHNGLHYKSKYEPFLKVLPDGTKIYFMGGSPMAQSGSGPDIVVYNYEQIASKTREIKKSDPSAIVVTYFHDGIERQIAPSDRQRSGAKLLALAGVDIMLFGHSHVYGNFETFNNEQNTFVIWSLGNFLFGGNSGWRNNNDVRMLKIVMDTETKQKKAGWVHGYTKNWKYFIK